FRDGVGVGRWGVWGAWAGSGRAALAGEPPAPPRRRAGPAVRGDRSDLEAMPASAQRGELERRAAALPVAPVESAVEAQRPPGARTRRRARRGARGTPRPR